MIRNLIKILKSGGIGVLPTDTIYGIVASALNKKAVLKVYRTRKRNPKKPFIILISSLKDLDLFGIKLSAPTRKILSEVWPGKVSVILNCANRKFSYLHRSTRTLAFRLPNRKWLIGLLKKTGPLIAPSANPEGLSPAKTIGEAKKYFGKQADFYLNAGKLESLPSTLIAIKNSRVIIKREGAVKLKLLT